VGVAHAKVGSLRRFPTEGARSDVIFTPRDGDDAHSEEALADTRDETNAWLYPKETTP
jgi:hypothetical protein